jgi:hypothetical protein
VIDTDRTDRWGNQPVVCECHDIETAKAIALALNRSAPSYLGASDSP